MKPLTAVTLAVCAAACAIVALPARGGPMSKPTPTPTPVAIGYDEISRMIAPPASPPPPGSFQADYQLALGGTSVPTAAESTPTPAPRRHGLGGLIGAISNPMQGIGGPSGPGGPGGPPGMGGQGMQMMNMMQHGHVVRYTFYWSKNWEREDDPVAKTATITKCPQHQIIHLNLAQRTYSIDDTSATPCGTTAPTQMMGPRGGASTQPGTVDMTFKSTSQNLGRKTLDGIATNGSSRDFDMMMSNATGSCTNGQFGMTTIVYVSGIRKQRAYCPLSMPKYVASSPREAMASGGCKPRFRSGGTSNPMSDTSQFLEMYMLTTMHQGAAGTRGGFSQLLERGNVDWYYKPQADPLFEIPAGFTKAS